MNAEYYIGNVRYEPSEYQALVRKMIDNIEEVRRNFDVQKKTMPRRYMDGIGNDHCTGNNILHSKNSHDCYEVINLEDCAYSANATFIKDAMDIDNDDHSELVYENVGADSNYHHLFSDISWFNKYLMYCSLCFHSESLFGCVGMRQKRYCILNKQYTKEEYASLVPRILSHMRETGEYGEFFPPWISPFSYNETLAQDYFPLTKENVVSAGWGWKDEQKNQDRYLGPAYVISANIHDIPDDITKQILTCEITGKPYKIIPQELKFYREMNIPIPRKCPDQRHKERMALRNPRKLWWRQCTKCQKDIQTTYAPERPEIVYCEECYLATVY